MPQITHIVALGGHRTSAGHRGAAPVANQGIPATLPIAFQPSREAFSRIQVNMSDVFPKKIVKKQLRRLDKRG